MKKTFNTAVDITEIKKKLLRWASAYRHIAHYDNNNYAENRYSRYECLCAVSNGAAFERNTGANAWGDFENYKNLNPNSWLFGYFGYDLKNELETLGSQNPFFHNTASLCFFIPEIVVSIEIATNRVEISALKPDEVWKEILLSESPNEYCPEKISMKPRITREEYLEAIDNIREHIIAGDIYELNFCQEFYAEGKLEPAGFYNRLNRMSPAPFSAWFKSEKAHIFSASPERFLYKDADKLVSQPIKGTIKRSTDNLEDLSLKEALRNSEKDRAENVMIVDLVRNDLSRTAKIGSVEVEELFGIYGFRQVWQMISTISARLKDEADLISAIKAAFPPGSMTGAPKIMSMQLIEQYESSARGSFSGTLGYFDPDGNFDFNVLIRSIFYNDDTQKISYQTGGAIVYDSEPKQEYEECMLKAKAMLLALGVEEIR